MIYGSRFWCALGCLLAGCGAPAESEDVERSTQPLASEAVLGFETTAGWSGAGIVGSSAEHSEGQSSLAVRPNGFSAYRSVAISYTGRLRQLALDVKLPATLPSGSWQGTVQAFLSSPSAGLNLAYVSQASLTGLRAGAFNTLTFDVPGAISQALGSGRNDLQVRLAISVPGAASTYLLDNLRLRTELLLHYRFDAASGTRVVDSSGYGRDGTLQGAAAIAADGRQGAALALDGVTGYVDVPGGVIQGATEVTVAAWVNVTSTGAWSRVFDFGGANGFMYLTPSTHDGMLRFSTFAGGTNEGTVTAPALATGVWKHVAVTTQGRVYRVYVDGVEASYALTIPTTPAETGASTESWLGRSRFPDPLLAGRIDDFRVYGRALSQPEIQALAAPQRDYVAYRFDATSGSTVTDSSELGYTGTTSGNASWVPGLIGQSLRLAGDGAHVRLPPGVVADCSDVTVSAWIRLRTNQPWNRVFDFGDAAMTSFFYLSPAGFGAAGQELRVGLVAPTGINDLGFPFVAPLSEWTHVGVTLRGSTLSLYLNGRAAARRNDVVTNPSDLGETDQNYLGRSQFADPYFDGQLDDMRVACRAYSDSEMAQLAHLPAPSVLPDPLPVAGAITDVHDPVLVEQAGTQYLFSTGPGVMVRTSSDLRTFTDAGRVFAENPPWIAERFGALESLWAPDVSQFGGQYHLYYAASSFGSNRSCIGHATKSDLSTSDPWEDRGPVLCSNEPGGSVDDFNAIDPNVIVDNDGTPWLAFGSFWSGLKMIRLDASGARADATLIDLASRGGGPIEAPFIVYRAPYYYLFASFDYCCRGSDSSYRVVVGRSTSVTGPYLDRTGLDMRLGGGTPVVTGNARWRGPGHNSVLRRGEEYVNVYHSYDAANGGIPTLRLSELVWQEGFPVSAEP